MITTVSKEVINRGILCSLRYVNFFFKFDAIMINISCDAKKRKPIP